MADNFGNMTITAANCTLFLTVPGLYDSPVQIEGFSTDAMVSVATNTPVVAEDVYKRQIIYCSSNDNLLSLVFLVSCNFVGLVLTDKLDRRDSRHFCYFLLLGSGPFSLFTLFILFIGRCV